VLNAPEALFTGSRFAVFHFRGSYGKTENIKFSKSVKNEKIYMRKKQFKFHEK